MPAHHLRPALLSVLLLAAIAVPAASQDEYQPLSGTYAITGMTLVDPPPDEPKDHLQLFLTGRAARDLYRALEVEAMPDECIGPSARSKFQGAIACTMLEGGEEYECSFGVNLKTQKLDSAHEC